MVDEKRFFALFEEIFHKNGLDAYVRAPIMRQFLRLTELMLETNAHMNITALTTLEKIIPLHYADCVKVVSWIRPGTRVLDVGCGGGFPILPLAIVLPEVTFTGLDSTDKKVRYVQKTADTLGLNVRTLYGRAEDLAKQYEHREQYDVVISRAVARLNVLDELCIPFVKVGGRFLAMKGAAGQEEYEEAKQGMETLGCIKESVNSYTLHTHDDTEARTTVCVQKEHSTPSIYPRAFGIMKKKPL